jgi:hypothetical protein
MGTTRVEKTEKSRAWRCGRAAAVEGEESGAGERRRGEEGIKPSVVWSWVVVEGSLGHVGQ